MDKSIKRAMLIILDGFGVNDDGEHNAIAQAKMPCIDKYVENYPYTTLEASGAAVGLPDGQMGNSEVGHITMGCGNIIHQDLVLINDAIHNESFFSNKTLIDALDAAKQKGRPIHLLGLVSDGGVHSHIDHLKALLKMCKSFQVIPALHMITDGRDTSPSSALSYLDEITPFLKDANGKIHTLCGRYYAMDRDRRWERTKASWDALVSETEGIGVTSVREAIIASYQANLTDEFIKPVYIEGTERIASNDDVIFFNFRNDRPRQLCEALCVKDFSYFERGNFTLANVRTMTVFHSTFDCPVAIQSEHPEITLAGVVSDAGLKQLHCAETEKYPHVTFFINGGKETPYEGEDRTMVPSPKVATYDLKPEMSAREVADVVIEALNNSEYHLIIVNFANGDMVGHTAIPKAIIKALEVMDTEVGRVLDTAVEQNVNVLLTSDHGNCDEMVDALSGDPHTQHTTNPVPCMVIANDQNMKLKEGEGLSSVSPTILDLMNIAKPKEMRASSIILSE